MPIDLNPMDAVRAVEELDKCIQIIGKYASRLKADPDKAANDLAEALEEVEKSCKALDDGIKKYLNLGLKSNALDDGSDVLLDISGGGLLAGVQKGLGSCQKMSNVYHNTINRWFERVFKSDNQAYRELADVFSVLGSADGSLFDLMLNTARQVQKHADQTLALVTQDKKQEARAQVLSSAAELNGLRVRINELLANLYGVRAQFIAVARV
jgi:hypothetical protein